MRLTIESRGSTKKKEALPSIVTRKSRSFDDATYIEASQSSTNPTAENTTKDSTHSQDPEIGFMNMKQRRISLRIDFDLDRDEGLASPLTSMWPDRESVRDCEDIISPDCAKHAKMTKVLKKQRIIEIPVQVLSSYERCYGPALVFLDERHHFDTMSWNC